MNAVIISPSVDAIIRAITQMGAGWLVASGHLDPTQTTTLIGGALALVSVVWSIFHKISNKAP